MLRGWSFEVNLKIPLRLLYLQTESTIEKLSDDNGFILCYPEGTLGYAFN